MAISSNFPTTRPSLILDFQKSEVVDPRITFTRTSSATRFNQYGVLEIVANNVPRIDFSPTTLLCNGLLAEEQRTNSIRNNTMVGAAAGTPGTLPTNWQKGEASSLAFNVVGTGTENGITYIDVRLSGTASATTSSSVQFEQNSQISASVSQTWALTSYAKISAGSTSGLSQIQFGWEERAGSFLASNQSAITPQNGGNLAAGRVTHVGVNANASTTFIKPYILFTPNNGAAIDITLRIGMPQLEQGAFATSVIPTTNAAVIRSIDFADITGTKFSSWYNATEGTLLTQAQDMSDATHSSAQPRVASINNGTNSTIDISRFSTSVQGRARIDDAGVNQFNSLTTAWPLATQAKIALAYKLNDAAACLGGTTVYTDNTATIPTVNTLTIGNYVSGSSNPWTGWIQRIVYYPTRLSNAQLQALTR
jgi:hypothetical protein